MGVVEGLCGFTRQGRWVILGKLVFLGRLRVQESGGGGVLTMDKQGYDPSVA